MKLRITLFLCLAAGLINAEESKTEERLLRLNKEHVVITATGTQRQNSTLPANVSVITQEDIRKSTAQTLPDVFRHLAGIDVREEFGDFSNTAVDIRGFGEVAAANTLIMVDGRKINRSDLAGVNYSIVPLNRVKRIEVYRGGRSVLYGNGATGGVINIITDNEREDGHTLRLNSEFGTQETYRYSAILEGKIGKTLYSLDSSYHDTNGWHVNNYERMKNAGFSVNIQELEDWDFLIRGYTSNYRVGTPGTRPSGGSRKDASNTNGYFESQEKGVSFSPRYWINDKVSLELGSTYRQGESKLVGNTGSISRSYYYNSSVNPKLQIEYDISSVKNTLITGFDYEHGKSILRNVERNRRSIGYYIYNTSSLFDDSLFIDLGYRRERYKINIQNSTQAFSPQDLDAATLGVTYKYAEGSKVFVSLDKSFRYQRVDELGGNSFNTSLPPQTTYTYQGGLAHKINDQLDFALTFFHIDSQNEIFYEPSVGSFGNNISYEYTEREGYEIEMNYRPLENLSFFINYTNMDTKLGGDSATSDGNKNNHIPSIPEETLNAGFSWDFVKHFNLSMSGKWADRFYVRGDYANSRDQDDGYIVVDAKLTFTWDWFSIYAGCNNLFDEAYNNNSATFGSYTAPGRNFFGGVSMTFEF